MRLGRGSSFAPPTSADHLCDAAGVDGVDLRYVEFPADDPARARRFWEGLLEVELAPREGDEGEGWETRSGAPVGVHPRGPGPGDRVSLPYFRVPDVTAALERVRAQGGEVIHAGERVAICRDSEGSPFGLTIAAR